MATINSPSTITAVAAGPISIVKLTSTLALCVYDVSSTIRAKTITIGADNSLTPNAELNIDPTHATTNEWTLVRMTATSAMLVYEYNNVDMRARVLTISGTNVIKNAQTTLTHNKATAADLSLALINSTNILYCYETTGVQAVVLSVSGTTITENSIVAVGSVATKNATKCSVYSSTRAIVTYVNNSTARMEGAILSISGTTLTANAQVPISTETVSTGENRNYCINMSATKAVVGFTDSNDRINFVLTLSGTTFNVGAVKADILTVARSFHAAEISSTGLITVTETSSDDMRAVVYSITGGGSDELTEDSTDELALSALTSIWTAGVDSNRIIALFLDSVGLRAATISAIGVFSGYDLVLGGGQL